MENIFQLVVNSNIFTQYDLGVKAEVTLKEAQLTNIADIRSSPTLKLQQYRHLALFDKRSEGYGSMMLEVCLTSTNKPIDPVEGCRSLTAALIKTDDHINVSIS